MYLSEVLKRGSNNFDLLRILLAILVLYSHVFVFTKSGSVDIMKNFGISSGALAVSTFFFLSGLLVTNSLFKNNSFEAFNVFAVSRILRIWPALITVVVITSVIVGPLYSGLDLTEYFNHHLWYKYIWNNITLNTQFILPDVFSHNLYARSVNGSIWTIRHEVTLYGILLCGYFLLKGNKKLIAVLCFIVICYVFVDQQQTLILLTNKKNSYFLIPCFLMGSLFSILQFKIKLNWKFFLLFIACSFIFKNTALNDLIYALTFFYGTLYIFSCDFVCRLKVKHDISYGVYLWGFPVQQVLSYHFSDYGLVFNLISAIIVSCLIGLLSFIYVEKPAMNLAKKWSSCHLPLK